ncbi:MAG: FHA domain-containing protein, partial [Micromonosporaceae bacterium]|nr:FHA domain-containing protein [Micromonosporaceae bacterium]
MKAGTKQGGEVRLGISHVLDTIEKKLSTDPTGTGAVVDLGEVMRLADLDGGRPAYLLRLGLIVDAVGRHLCDDGISVYAVADRALLSDIDLTANEKIVIRRWSDDGQIEIVPNDGPPAAARAREVAALTGLPLISRQASGYPGLTYAPAASGNTINLVAKMLGPGPAAPAPVLGRRWRCPETYCASFGEAAGDDGP